MIVFEVLHLEQGCLVLICIKKSWRRSGAKEQIMTKSRLAKLYIVIELGNLKQMFGTGLIKLHSHLDRFNKRCHKIKDRMAERSNNHTINILTFLYINTGQHNNKTVMTTSKAVVNVGSNSISKLTNQKSTTRFSFANIMLIVSQRKQMNLEIVNKKR